jgi:hypothetical protein
MRLESIKVRTTATVAAGLILYSSLGLNTSLGDEPGLLGRLFRTGSSNSGSNSASNPGPVSSSSNSPSPIPAPSYFGQPAVSTPASTTSMTTLTPHVKPKPRVNKPVTEADPMVTRISLGRSDNGSQFGMLLQVFADGTVIDGEGVHHVSGEALKPVVEAVTAGDLAKLKGHCGGPAGDFIENVHVVVFERSLGRLRANSFSYSGNPQGCDHAVHHLQKVLDELQTKLIPVAPTTSPTASNAPAPSRGLTSPPLPLTTP